jgi:hypothetical protein
VFAPALEQIEIVNEGRGRFRATVSVSGGLVYELPEKESFDKREGAEQAAATMALLQVRHTSRPNATYSLIERGR